MRDSVFACAAIALLLLTGCGGDGGSRSANPLPGTETNHPFSIIGMGFQPDDLVIDVGDTITWTNNRSTLHTVTATSEAVFGSGNLSSGESYMRVFNSSGRINRHCSLHSGMTGSIVVQ